MGGDVPIARRTRMALAWSGQRDTVVLIGTTIAANLVRIASSMILTRLLAPDVFGMVGIISSVFFIVAMLTDLGFQGYVVRHRDGDDPHFLKVIWTIHAARGVGLTLVAAALAVPLARAFGKPELAWPLFVTSITFLINGVTSLSLITALRNKGIAKLCYLDLGLLIFQTVVGIAAAMVLHNVWAIILAIVASAMLRAVLSYGIFSGSRSGLALDRKTAREFWKFSRVVMGSSFLTLVLSQFDKMWLARVFSLSDFGVYVIATALASVPLGFVNNYADRILYPRYAKAFLETPERLADIYYASRRRISLLYGFGAGGLLGGASLLIRLLYDPRYAGASTYLSLLAVATTVLLSNRAANEMLIAIGEVKTTLIANMARLCWLLTAGSAAYVLFGAIGLVTAIGMIEFPPLFYNWRQLHRFGIFDAGEEALQIGAAVMGIGSGFAIAGLASLVWH